MNKRTCIITGGNSGIGFDVAKRLVCHNYDVVLACRNEMKGLAAVESIKAQYPDTSVSYMHLDLSSIASVVGFVKVFNESKKNLQLLINNAGIFGKREVRQPSITADKLEETFQVNHLGHFYLTLLLLENLKRNSPSRIIMVSSMLHDPVKKGLKSPGAHLDFDNLMLTEKDGTFSSGLAYKNSKLANILFTYELSSRLPPNCGITINAMNPGFIPRTGLMKASSCKKGCFACCFGMCGITASLEDSSNCLVYMSCSDTLDDVTGKYFDKCEEVRSSQESYDKGVAVRLWNFSMDLLQIQEEPCVMALRV